MDALHIDKTTKRISIVRGYVTLLVPKRVNLQQKIETMKVQQDAEFGNRCCIKIRLLARLRIPSVFPYEG